MPLCWQSPCGLTCLLAGEGKNDDVIKGPGVVRVRRVECQVPGCCLPQVNQEGRVHHGDCKAAPAVPLPNGDVGGCALVVALWGGRQSSIWGSQRLRLEAWDKGRHGTLGEQDSDASLWLCRAFPECGALGAVRHLPPQSLRWWGSGAVVDEGGEAVAHLQI